jgi:predicted RNase H-like HicB family nuclease
MMKRLTVPVVVEREDDPAAGYSAYCPTLPGCFSNGHTLEEAKRNMQQAIAQHLSTLLANGEVVPLDREDFQIDRLSFFVPE